MEFEFVILVNENDQEVGQMEKLEAHQKGALHRAFSILIFNSKNELLLHQRADDKYHSGGLWTNTCCSHPRIGEETLDAANRRLNEEMGFNTQLTPAFKFIYIAELDAGLTEHELDHVFIGHFEGDFIPNPKEVQNTKWLSISQIQKEINALPESYTEWFKILMTEYEEFILNMAS
jgi:isopentenyl-diphosphate Delta-isomerase